MGVFSFQIGINLKTFSSSRIIELYYLRGLDGVKKKYLALISLVLIFLLAACGSNNEKVNNKKADDDKSTHEVEKTEDEEQIKLDSPLEILNHLATLSKETDELYVTDEIEISEDGEVTPGIYDVEITGGSGNIFGERKNVDALFINWVGEAKGEDYPSKIRMILFDGDTLTFDNISKVKFHAVPEEVETSNELGIGEFIVGRDILPGDYKLSTNVNLSTEFDNLGWNISIYNDESGKVREQMLTGTNDDVAVKLQEGEVIQISYDNTDYGSSSDDAKLTFTEL